MLFVSLILLLN